MSDKETWVVVNSVNAHGHDIVLFSVSRAGFTLPANSVDLARAKAALEDAIKQIARFEAAFNAS